jgi:hypothetical protein
MKVDIDILNPAISGLKQQWQQLPEPVRDVMPFAGQHRHCPDPLQVFNTVGVVVTNAPVQLLGHSRC